MKVPATLITGLVYSASISSVSIFFAAMAASVEADSNRCPHHVNG